MIRRAVAGLAAAVLATGCGVLDDPDPAGAPRPDARQVGPLQAVPRERPPARSAAARVRVEGAVARELDAGTPGVVGVYGAVGVRPTRLDTSEDAQIERITWSRWDAGGAQGRGELVLRICQPTCAGGHSDTIPATIELSAPRECSGRRYFDTAALAIDPRRSPDPGAQPTSYVRAPC